MTYFQRFDFNKSVRLSFKCTAELTRLTIFASSIPLFCLLCISLNKYHVDAQPLAKFGCPTFDDVIKFCNLESVNVRKFSGTFIFIHTELNNFGEPSRIPVPIVSINPSDLQLDQSYDVLSFQKELTTDQVINPILFGTLKYSANGASISLCGKGNEVRKVVDVLITRRFARPHKEFFFFYLNEHLDTESFIDLRYKYEMVLDSNGIFGVTGFCGKRHEIFSHFCPGLIEGRKIRLASSNTPALFRPATKYGRAEGTMRLAFDEIDRRYNSSTFIRLSSYNGSAGMRLNNGTGIWKGTVGDVFDRHVNISIATGMTRERLRFTDFSITQLWNERVFYIRTPPHVLSLFTFSRPLTYDVWALTGCTLFGLVFPAMYLSVLFQDGFDLRGRYFRPALLFRAMDTIWCIVLEQSTFTRIWHGGRTCSILLLWTAVCLVVTTGYKSKLVNFLTFVEREQVPRTHMDLSLSPYKLFFRTYKGIAFLETSSSTNPMHKRFMARAKFPEHSYECFKLALTSDKSACMDFILNGEYTIAVNTTLKTTGNLQIFIRSTDIDIRWMIMWIFAKGSPLTQTYDRIKLGLLAGGHFDKWMKDDWALKKTAGMQWLENETDADMKSVVSGLLEELGHRGPKPLKRKNILPVMLLLALGLGIGGAAWTSELINKKIKNFYAAQLVRRGR